MRRASFASAQPATLHRAPSWAMKPPVHRPSEAIERERGALGVHRHALRGAALPHPREAPRGTFVHGFLLPFSLILSMLRDSELRRPYLRLVLVRGLVVAVAALVLFQGGGRSEAKRAEGIVVSHGADPAKAKELHVHVPGMDLDFEPGHDSVKVLGRDIPVKSLEAEAARAVEAEAHAGTLERGWKWLAALVALLSTLEGVVVFFSRRWDDWLSFHGARLATILPEDEEPKDRRLAVDLKWLVRKLKRRVRGYLVFAAGVPLMAPLHLVPVVGSWAFAAAATLWGWYWLGVFTAAKSAHAWADRETAPSPRPIRAFHARVPGWIAPLTLYGRVWARVTRELNSAATAFDRSPSAFLGLALARALLAAPGLYLFARPIVPIAAGRLCAEADPDERFTAEL